MASDKTGTLRKGTRMRLGARLKDWARAIKRDVVALHIATRDPRVPWYTKAAAVAIAAYALSPIDLIPDFIPILGYLDEVILLPIAIWFGLRLVPAPVIDDARKRAEALDTRKPRLLAGAFLIIGIWIFAAAAGGILLYGRFYQ